MLFQQILLMFVHFYIIGDMCKFFMTCLYIVCVGNMSQSADVIDIEIENTENEINDNAPLWKYVKKMDKVGKGGGNNKFECNYCGKIFTGSYSRVKSHLLKMTGNGISVCKKVSNEAYVEMQNLVKECEDRVKSSAPRPVPLPNSSNPVNGYIDMLEPETQKKRKGGPLEKSFRTQDRDLCDAEVARMFYTGGLSFNLAKNPHYRASYTRASKIPGYVPPGIVFHFLHFFYELNFYFHNDFNI